MANILNEFYDVMISNNNWKYIVNGLKNTLILTVFACILGIALGTTVAIIRTTYDTHGKETRNTFLKFILTVLNAICKIYLTVIRGTPVVVQILIVYYVIFASSNNKLGIGILTFGINSGAYVAEIIRSGIMSIDKGQYEAGRSLGFNYIQTMIYIVAPQAFKNVLPTLANEFIVLLKETAVAGYIALEDLTKGGDIIRSLTYTAYMPLLTVAAVYLAMVMFFTWLVGKLERRLRTDER
ncbi:MAG: amino acid ABC transporter permease [Lachnospiraceae bacterium]|nr:amino acid ABC transporter permease [Lachnospiraceae bacterium]